MNVLTCPDWCIQTPEDHATDDEGTALHHSAWNEAGFSLWRDDSLVNGVGAVEASLYSEIYGLGVDDLRELAANALKAAEWLETHL